MTNSAVFFLYTVLYGKYGYVICLMFTHTDALSNNYYFPSSGQQWLRPQTITQPTETM